MKRSTAVAIFRYALIALILFSLFFIFYQSILPPEKSTEESETVGGILEEIFPPDTEAGKFVLTNIRKIAHFTEFFVLGVWTSLYGVFFIKRRTVCALSFPMALFVAFLDETIQIFSGRGPMIFDVWIDFFGFLTSGVIIYTVAYLTLVIRQKANKS